MFNLYYVSKETIQMIYFDDDDWWIDEYDVPDGMFGVQNKLPSWLWLIQPTP